MERAEHLHPWLMGLVVTFLPAVCDPESEEEAGLGIRKPR